MPGTDVVLARLLLEKSEEPNIFQALAKFENLKTRSVKGWVKLRRSIIV